MMRPAAAPLFREKIAKAYEGKFGITPRVYECKPSAGAGELAS